MGLQVADRNIAVVCENSVFGSMVGGYVIVHYDAIFCAMIVLQRAARGCSAMKPHGRTDATWLFCVLDRAVLVGMK